MLFNAILVHHQEPIRVLIENSKPFVEWLTNPSSIIALTAIILTIINLSIQRRHNRKSVTPLLSIKTEYDLKEGQNVFTTLLKNCGPGPALIQSCVYSCYRPNVRTTNTDIKDVLHEESNELFNLLDKENSITTTIDNKYVLGSNDEIPLHNLKFYPGKNKKEIRKILMSYQLEIEYKSIYGKKFHFKDTID